jgi:hypothetical protein
MHGQHTAQIGNQQMDAIYRMQPNGNARDGRIIMIMLTKQ